MDALSMFIQPDVLHTLQTSYIFIQNVIHDILLKVLRIYLHIFFTRNLVRLPRVQSLAITINPFENSSLFCRVKFENETCHFAW